MARKQRSSFQFQYSWRELVSGLSTAERCAVYEAAIAYAQHQVMPNLQGAADRAFQQIKADIDKANDRSEYISEQRRAVVTRRWHPAETSTKTTKNEKSTDTYNAKNAIKNAKNDTIVSKSKSQLPDNQADDTIVSPQKNKKNAKNKSQLLDNQADDTIVSPQKNKMPKTQLLDNQADDTIVSKNAPETPRNTMKQHETPYLDQVQIRNINKKDKEKEKEIPPPPPPLKKKIKEKEKIHTQNAHAREGACKGKNPIFTPPTLQEVEKYAADKNLCINPEKFIAYHESQGWLVGRNPMKNWKAAAKYWAANQQPANHNSNHNSNSAHPNLGVGEFFNDKGQRTFSQGGVIVPDDAPPRPSNAHWWNEISNRWEDLL